MLGFNGGLLGKKRKQELTTPGLWFPNERAIIASSDPYWNNVSLLLHMDGSNGSQAITDSSVNSLTVTAQGSTAISTAQFKHGTGSLEFFGNSADYANIAANTLLNMSSGDFTLECWARLKAMPTGEGYPNAKYIIGTGPANSSTGSALYIGASNLHFDLTFDGSSEVNAAHGMVINTWYHIAVTRSGNTFKGFVNGSQIGSTSTSSASWANGYGWGIGAAEFNTSLAANFNGYIDDLRITKGIARYTANFTAPTGPFPDF